MAKGGATRKIEDTIKALDEKQIKKALYLTENHPKLERQHQFVVEAAQTCLANKGNKQACEEAIKMARDRVQETVSLPIDDTSLEGLEEYLAPAPSLTPALTPSPTPDEDTPVFPPPAQPSDDELFAECEECHIAVAASRFADICAERPDEAGGCETIGRSLQNEDTEPADWLKAMIETTEKAQGTAKEEMAAALADLGDYLQKRDSPLLKALEQGG